MTKFDIARLAVEIVRVAWGRAAVSLGAIPSLDEPVRDLHAGFFGLYAAITAAEREHDQQRASATD